jgi:hypothetical protein
MLPWLISKWSWKSFAVGAGAALFGGTIARPALVQAVKVGMVANDYAADTITQAKTEFGRMKDDAVRLRTAESAQPAGYADLVAEMQKLRDEISSLKGTLGKSAQKA